MASLWACRDPTRVRRTLRSLKEATGNQHIYGYAYDLSSLQQTRSFSAHLRRDIERHFDGSLDVLINNAGVFEEDLHITEVGCCVTNIPLCLT